MANADPNSAAFLVDLLAEESVTEPPPLQEGAAEPETEFVPVQGANVEVIMVGGLPMEVEPMSPDWPFPQPASLQEPPRALGSPSHKRRLSDDLDSEPEMAGFDDAMGLPYGTGIHNEMPSLPPDASSTIYAEGLPSNITGRELAHIFRPFNGFREVRLVNDNSHKIAFVDYATPAEAFSAMRALQGYWLDIDDQDSRLHLQLSRDQH
ncbi:RNA-binding protein 2 [Brachypodium distachyon]|nr:RNA-binding protein 2 [Brachypodium distachyon]|eukprot:XP_014758096.1 RNA-binding protein 2 [Brachypodium distachyon]